MSEKSRVSKTRRVAVKKPDSFQLPRSIAKELKKCMQSYSAGETTKSIQYLWINLANHCGNGGASAPVQMSGEDWASVVDEAASMGAHFIVVCVGDSLSAYPEIWKVCQWAQEAHGITVGLHTFAPGITEGELNELKTLNPNLTLLFVNRESIDAMAAAREAGIQVVPAEVEHTNEKWPPCEGPRSMVFAGPGGILYSCGLVVGNEKFRLGHVFDQPLKTVLDAKSGQRLVPEGTEPRAGGCDGCPNRMIKRIAKPGM